MFSGKVAIPTNDSNGIKGNRSGHFGHCKFFTVVDVDSDNITDINTLANKPHKAGGCQSVVQMLSDNQVNAVVTAGMGNGPYKKFEKTSIQVFFADQDRFPDVQSVIDGLQNETIAPFVVQNLCKGSGNCHQHKHQHQHQHQHKKH